MLSCVNSLYHEDDPRLEMYLSLWPKSFLASPITGDGKFFLGVGCVSVIWVDMMY